MEAEIKASEEATQWFENEHKNKLLIVTTKIRPFSILFRLDFCMRTENVENNCISRDLQNFAYFVNRQ